MQQLIELMEQVENPGVFSVSGVFTSLAPGLVVDNFGPVSLPIIPAQAQGLIKLAEQAPFGRGEATVTDTTVRNVWQIGAEHFSVGNPQWLLAQNEAVKKMAAQLGLHDCHILCEPYKLLIYEQGSFFVRHRDTEKLPNMFATLVVNLPSPHQGGEVIVSHGGQSQSYCFADNDGFNADFAVFYADCYHEVKPLISGYRVCLVYNLTIEDRPEQPRLSQQSTLAQAINEQIKQWVAANNPSPLLTYLLDHSYSEKNLSMANLKNGDYAKAALLLDAGHNNGCQAYLCLATYYRASYGDISRYDYSRYSRHDNRGHEVDEDDFEEVDVEIETFYITKLMTKTDEVVPLAKLALEEQQIWATIPLLAGPDRACSISEATGNEGASKELWYQRGAVILWPKDREIEVVAAADVSFKSHYLAERINANDLADATKRQQLIALAKTILEKRHPAADIDITPQLLSIDDIDLFKQWLSEQLKSFNLASASANVAFFKQIADHCGWQTFTGLVSQTLTPTPAAIDWLCKLLKTQLSEAGRGAVSGWSGPLLKPIVERTDSQRTLSTVLQIAILLGDKTMATDIIGWLSTRTTSTFLINTYGNGLVSASAELNDLLTANDSNQRITIDLFKADLLRRIAIAWPAAPVAPADWARPGKLPCKCPYCHIINGFLAKPDEREVRIAKTLKRELLHVELLIGQSQVEVDVELRRDPPKFSGIFTKNQRGYEQLRQIYTDSQRIVAALAEV